MHLFSNRLRGKLLAAFLLLIVCLSTGAGTLAQQPPPLTPTLLTPPAAFTTSNPRPTLSWQPINSADYYQVQLSRSTQFAASEQDVQVVNGSHVTTSALADGTYYWRVRAVSQSNIIGQWSSPRQFKVNQALPQEEEWMGESYLSIPHSGIPNGAPSGQVVINEVCTEICDGGGDTIELYNAGNTPVNITNWRLTLYLGNTLSLEYYFPSFTLAAGSYVSVIEGGGTNTGNMLFLGSTVNIPYVADSTGAITLRSTAPTGIDFLRFRSSYPYDTNSSVAPPAGTTWVGPDPLSNQSNNSFGRDIFSLDTNKGSDWLQPQNDTINAVNQPPLPSVKPASSPTQLAPTANAATNSDPVIFRWGAVANAQTYRFEVHTNATCTSLSDVVDVSALTINQSFIEGIYYWRVRAENGIGVGAWSTCRKLTYDITAPAVAPALTSPINGATVTLPKPTLVWKSVAGAARYEVGLELGDSTTPQTVATVTTLSYVPPNNLVTGRYYWRVRALDAAGNAGPWSNSDVPEDFLLMSSSSSAPVLNQSDVDLVWVSWVGVSWANAYEIQVDNNSAFNSLEYVEQDVPRYAETWTVGPLPADGLYYWRIRARKDDNSWGAWSKTQTFYVNVP